MSKLTPQQQLLQEFAAAGVMAATAESCTGGAIAAGITALPGASTMFAGGVVSYSNFVKINVLGVDAECLERHGAVSEPVARQMAAGARRVCGADYAVATSGIAGPGGGSEAKPVGTVCMAVASPRGVASKTYHFSGDRAEVISQASRMAVNNLLSTFRGSETLI